MEESKIRSQIALAYLIYLRVRIIYKKLRNKDLPNNLIRLNIKFN